MQYIFPNYYKDFRCKAGDCIHNCCIGWEIEIDKNTLKFYNSLDGSMGKRLKSNIDFKDNPHFVLGTRERCPFLNNDNLCDIIITLGEENLCDICKDHPRFRNELPDRTEIGLGLCCEAAAELILSQKSPMTLVSDEPIISDDEIINLRERLISALQDRQKTITERIGDMLSLCGAKMPYTVERLTRLLLSLERLDEKWTCVLQKLLKEGKNADYAGFDCYMRDRQSELEQFAVYLLYRHFANAPTMENARARAAFVAAAYYVIRAIGAVEWTQKGEFPFNSLADTARMFSAEIEYSDENLYILLDAFVGDGVLDVPKNIKKELW